MKSVDIAKIKKEAADEQRELILGLAEAHFGGEDGAKFKALVESGISVEQYKATSAALRDQKASRGAEDDARDKALQALKDSGAPNPGAGSEPAGGKEYMVLVEEYRAQHKCSKTDAMMAINRSHPKARSDYIAKNNPGLIVAK